MSKSPSSTAREAEVGVVSTRWASTEKNLVNRLLAVRSFWERLFQSVQRRAISNFLSARQRAAREIASKTARVESADASASPEKLAPSINPDSPNRSPGFSASSSKGPKGVILQIRTAPSSTR
jgi:hypothetical protein